MPNLTAMITGGTRGIGKAIVETLAKKGYNIIITFNKSKLLAESFCNEIKQNYGVDCRAYQADFAVKKDVENLIKQVLDENKAIDVLINNAGVCLDMELRDRTISHFEKTFKINLFSVFSLSKAVGERMVENRFGKIVNISSDNSLTGYYPTTIDYDSSKAALNVLTKDLAIEFAPYVNVNAVAPGWVDTDMNKNVLTPDIMELEAQNILKKRIGRPQDVANLVSFLVSDEADYINGEIIVIDGGRL